MKRRFVLFTLLFFSFSLLFAAPGPDFHKKGHKNFHGKRMMEEDGEFQLIFVKAEKLPDSYNFGLVFSQPVNPISITDENFLLNENTIHLKNIRFSKNYRIIEFNLNEENDVWTEENVNLTVKDIESISGKKIEPVIIHNFQIEKDYRLMKKDER